MIKEILVSTKYMVYFFLFAEIDLIFIEFLEIYFYEYQNEYQKL